MITRYLPALVASLAPLAGWAQFTPLSAVPRAYVGLALYTSEYQPLSFTRDSYYGARHLPAQLRLGYQLSARWALQGSVAYSAHQGGARPADSLALAGPGPYTYFESSGYRGRRNISVALVGRYCLTRPLARRLRVEALGGATLEKTLFEREYNRSYFDSRNAYLGTTSRVATERQTGVLATAGVGLRYRIIPHLEAIFDGTANVDFCGNFSGLSSSLALGLQATVGHQ